MADEMIQDGTPMRIVESSNIHAVGYDATDKILKVRFNSGELYYYFEVPPELHEQLMLAPSIGKFFNQFVKKRYAYGRMEP